MGLSFHNKDKDPKVKQKEIRLKQLQQEQAWRLQIKSQCLSIIKQDFQLINKPKAKHKVPQLAMFVYIADRYGWGKAGNAAEFKVFDALMLNELGCTHVEWGDYGRFYKGIIANDPKLFRIPCNAKDPALVL